MRDPDDQEVLLLIGLADLKIRQGSFISAKRNTYFRLVPSLTRKIRPLVINTVRVTNNINIKVGDLNINLG